MKSLYLLSLLSVATFLVSCGDDDPVLTTVDWILDGSDLSDTRMVGSGENTMMTLNLKTTDLCPSHGVRVQIVVDRAVEFDELIENFDFTLNLEVPKNIAIDISTSIEGIPNSPINCITLGSVQCSLTY